MGVIEYNKINAHAEQRHRTKLKSSMGEEEYQRQHTNYIKEYRKKQKALRVEVEKKSKGNKYIIRCYTSKKSKKEIIILSN